MNNERRYMPICEHWALSEKAVRRLQKQAGDLRAKSEDTKAAPLVRDKAKRELQDVETRLATARTAEGPPESRRATHAAAAAASQPREYQIVVQAATKPHEKIVAQRCVEGALGGLLVLEAKTLKAPEGTVAKSRPRPTTQQQRSTMPIREYH